MPRMRDITGQTFGLLTAISPTEKRRGGKIVWKFSCQCNNVVEVVGQDVTSGNTTSCGCERVRVTVKRSTTHGASGASGKRHPIYQIWASMHSRCYYEKNIHYDNYGGKGIDVCEEWHEFEPFRDYMLSLENCPSNAQTSGAKLALQIDRIRGSEGYKPGNIRWATPKQQQNNRSNNRFVIYKNQEMLLSEFIEKHTNVSYSLTWKRLFVYNWTPEQAAKPSFLKPIVRVKTIPPFTTGAAL